MIKFFLETTERISHGVLHCYCDIFNPSRFSDVSGFSILMLDLLIYNIYLFFGILKLLMVTELLTLGYGCDKIIDVYHRVDKRRSKY